MARIKLRQDAFGEAMREAGFPSARALAKAMSVNHSTVTRVMRGELQAGPEFIGGALTALAPLAFADLFEVVTPAPQQP